jgi:hypothetical protein
MNIATEAEATKNSFDNVVDELKSKFIADNKCALGGATMGGIPICNGNGCNADERNGARSFTRVAITFILHLLRNPRITSLLGNVSVNFQKATQYIPTNLCFRKADHLPVILKNASDLLYSYVSTQKKICVKTLESYLTVDYKFNPMNAGELNKDDALCKEFIHCIEDMVCKIVKKGGKRTMKRRRCQRYTRKRMFRRRYA